MSVWSIPWEAFEDLPNPGDLIGFERVPTASVVKVEHGLVLVEVEHRFRYDQPEPLPGGTDVGEGVWRFRYVGLTPNPGERVYCSNDDPEAVTTNAFYGGHYVGTALACAIPDRSVYVRVGGAPEAVSSIGGYDEDAEACEHCSAGAAAAEAPLLDRIESAIESEVLDVDDTIAILEEASDTLRAIQDAMS